MSDIPISVPRVSINGDVLKIVPNSVVAMGGEGEVTVRAASAGDNSVETIHTENAEDKIGGVKFELYVTDNLDALIRDWKGRIGSNAIALAQTGGNFSKFFNGCSLTNHPERNYSVDGTCELEFKGDPMAA